MDNHQLRSILLNLQYRLSDNDRERLHFYLKNDVPRTLGDDSTLNGTLRLMQSLFDQDKINEKDFSLLIDAFKQIRCFDAVQLLKEHQRRMLLNGFNQSTQSLASIMPSIIEEFINEYEDERQDVTDNFILNRMNYSNNNNNIIDSNNITINENTERTSSPSKQCFTISSLKNKYFLFPFISFILTLGILIFIIIEGNDRINHVDNNLRMNQHFIIETLNQNNQTVKQLNNLLSEKNATIEQLNKTLIESKNERSTTLIKAGQKFGGDGGGDFDDSLLPNFTSSHYLSGFLFSDIDSFDACQFIYTSSHNNQSRIESNVYGGNGERMNTTYEYHLNDNERVEKVQVKALLKTFINANNGLKFTTKIIRGLKFITTKGRTIPSDIPLTGNDVQSEQFRGYTLGYVTGKSGLRIDQLQFFWYRVEQ